MKTILVVDDECALVDNLVDLFEHEGFRVVSASHGKEGIVCALAEKPDLVLTDFMMPIANGRDLVLGLRALHEFERTPIVMMSETTESVALDDGVGGVLPVTAFVSKPLSWIALFAVVSPLVGPAR